jgi:hypothetical protein
VFDKVTITYRGATYEIGRGRDFYGIWTVGGPRSHPLQWWPETAEGWSAAWSRFTAIEVPGTIAPVGRRTPPIARSDAPAAAAAAPLAERSAGQGGPGQGGPGTTVLEDRPSPYAPGAPFAQETPFTRGSPFGQRSSFGPGTPSLSTRTGTVAAATLLAAGVVIGIAGLFPDYLAGPSLVSQATQVVPHAIYLAVWTASAVLIVLGGVRLRLGALLAAGMSVVTFGLFFADAGTAIVGGGQAGGWGLWLSLVGWLACAAGSALAMLLRPAGGRGPAARSLSRPRGASIGPAVLLVLAGLGAAAAFAPSWDSYTLRTAAGLTRSLTEGNAFSNPGLVIAGDVAVMIALAAVVIVAALWRPIRHGAVLLAGAAIPMVAQAISAVIQVGGGASPTQFGITPAEASQLGLTIASGVTPDFWIYCGFLLALVVSCAWMLFMPHEPAGPVSARPAGADAYPWPAGPPAAGTATAEESSVPSPPAPAGDSAVPAAGDDDNDND